VLHRNKTCRWDLALLYYILPDLPSTAHEFHEHRNSSFYAISFKTTKSNSCWSLWNHFDLNNQGRISKTSSTIIWIFSWKWEQLTISLLFHRIYRFEYIDLNTLRKMIFKRMSYFIWNNSTKKSIIYTS